uniref:Uncharacterized protein n=1 Tax=Aegilops tauschii subsp. strangulata TaxID=200361 RepID=A0A453AD08_AEGTS
GNMECTCLLMRFMLIMGHNLIWTVLIDQLSRLQGGGHTAPSYQPERCLAMLRRWISNEPL